MAEDEKRKAEAVAYSARLFAMCRLSERLDSMSSEEFEAYLREKGSGSGSRPLGSADVDSVERAVEQGSPAPVVNRVGRLLAPLFGEGGKQK